MIDKISEQTSFNLLFSHYRIRFIRFAQMYIRDETEAESIVMDALIYYWERRESMKDESNIPAYVFTVIKHKCLNYLRRKQLEQQITTHLQEQAQWMLDMSITTLEACDPAEIFSNEAQRLVNQAIDKLPQKSRRIFMQSRLEDKTYVEIAAKENMTVKNVEYHISKSLKILREELKDYLPLFFFFCL